MIRFICRQCGYKFEVPQELAGSPLQCPDCGLLSDVPTLSDLPNLLSDGTYRMGEALQTESDGKLAELLYVYSKTKVDPRGNEIDLRGPADEDRAYELAQEPPPERKPKYDPETGELIRPVDIRQDAQAPIDPHSIPIAKPVLVYASGETARRAGLWHAFLELFRPANLLVIIIAYFAHVFIGGLMFMAGFLLAYIVVPVLIGILLAILGHWGNIVDEIGRQERDELPRVFRDLQFYEDIWQPFCALALGIMICYTPARLAMYFIHPIKVAAAATLALELAGTFLFPAIFITASQSGSIVNLHPARVWSVIRACGTGYAVAVLVWAISAPIYFTSVWIILIGLTGTLGHFPHGAEIGALSLPVGAVGVFLMHWFCMIEGRLYAANHSQFNWAFQYHARKPETIKRPKPKLQAPLGGSRSPDRARELNGRPLRQQQPGDAGETTP